MLDNSVSKLLNQQINQELFSAYLYLDIANYYADQGLDGFEHWFYIQVQEERDHAMLYRSYMINNDEKIQLNAVAQPGGSYQDFQAPLTLALLHEQAVTASIHRIYDAAQEVHDYRTMQFLDWFVKEQGEEEKNTSDLVKRFELFGSDPKGLYMLDTELKSRVYAPPSLVL